MTHSTFEIETHFEVAVVVADVVVVGVVVDGSSRPSNFEASNSAPNLAKSDSVVPKASEAIGTRFP